MRRLRFFILCLLLTLLQSCGDPVDPIIDQLAKNFHDTVSLGCLSDFDLELPGNGDTINRVYGAEEIKHGRWIIYALKVKSVSSATLQGTNGDQVQRFKVEEGIYRHNKKEGLWKYFSEDGVLRYSVKYNNDVAAVQVQ